MVQALGKRLGCLTASGVVSAQGGRMEIHQLKYFICVAKLESISKAATMLHLSQPALSKSLAKLEDELGVQLFDRLGKRLHLNDRGKLFLKGAEKALQELDGAAASVNAGTGSLQGSLSVGVFGVQDSAISCVQRFMQANRQTHVMLDARQRSITVRSVREFDMVFYPEGPAFGGIAGIPYARNRVRLAVPASHPLAAVGIADLVQFKDDPFVFMNTTAGVYEQSYQLCVENGFTPWVRAVTSSGMAQQRLIGAGLGVGFADAPSHWLDERAARQNGTTCLSASKALATPCQAPLSPFSTAGEAPGGETATGHSGASVAGPVSPAEDASPAAAHRRIRLLELRSGAPEQTLCFACRPVHLLSPTAREFLSFVLQHFALPDDDRVALRFEGN